MDILNNILLNMDSSISIRSILFVLSIDFVICLLITISLIILGYILSFRISNSIKLSFFRSIRWVLYILIWVYFVKISIDLVSTVYLTEHKEQIYTYTENAVKFLVYIAIIMNIFKFLNKVKQIVIEKNKKNSGGYDDFRDINAIFKALELLAVIISIILILAALDVPLTALGAFSGVALAGLTLSQSTLLTNFFGGLFVVFNRKYSEGDVIASDINSTIKFAGSIKKIGILTTQVDNYETAPMHIPNSIFLTTCITTTSRRTHRRIVQNITIPYENLDKVEIIKQDIKEMVKNHPDIDENKTIAVSLLTGGTIIGNRTEGSFGANGINLQIYAMVKKVFYVDFLEVQDSILIKTAQILNGHGIEFAINPVTILTVDNKNL